MEDGIKTPQEQVDYFCAHCWDNEYTPKIMFQALWESFIFNLSHEEMKKIIPQLVAKSKHYPQLVYLAENLFKRLSQEEQKQLKFNSPHWSYDEKVIAITEAEYKWRKKRGKPCKHHRKRFSLKCRCMIGGGYTRPSEVTDFSAYECILEMLRCSESSVLIMA